jgi:hypothetical protein
MIAKVWTADRRAVLVGIGSLALAIANRAAAQAPGKSVGPPKGTLLIIGGGERPADIQNAAIQLSGGNTARWVYIPTASSDAELPGLKPPAFIARAGVSATVLHTRDRKIADSVLRPRFARRARCSSRVGDSGASSTPTATREPSASFAPCSTGAE